MNKYLSIYIKTRDLNPQMLQGNLNFYTLCRAYVTYISRATNYLLLLIINFDVVVMPLFYTLNPITEIDITRIMKS